LTKTCSEEKDRKKVKLKAQGVCFRTSSLFFDGTGLSVFSFREKPAKKPKKPPKTKNQSNDSNSKFTHAQPNPARRKQRPKQKDERRNYRVRNEKHGSKGAIFLFFYLRVL
jgi:hypothetical protein